MATILKQIIPTGTTGTVATGVYKASVDSAADRLAVQFVVEAAGATPTVTWKAQGSLDGVDWYDLMYFPDGSDTASKATTAATAVGAQVVFLDLANGSRFYQWVQVITTANTNVTYRAELYYQQRQG